MGELVSKPERDDFWVQSEPLRVGILGTREMLEADESNSAMLGDQLAGVCGPDTDHEHGVDLDIHRQKLGAACFGITCNRYDIRTFEHPLKITTLGVYRRSNHRGEMRPVWIADVLTPV